MASITSRKSAAERRTEILAAAEHIALTQGLAAITMRSVAQQAGIAPTLVVHHVESMEQLVADAFGSVVSTELADIQQQLAFHEPQSTSLNALLTLVIDDTRTEVTGVWVDGWSLGRTSAPLAARVRTEMDTWRNFLTELIILGCRAGHYGVPEADAPVIAGQLLGMIDGLNAHSLVGWANNNRAELMLRACDAMLLTTATDPASPVTSQ